MAKRINMQKCDTKDYDETKIHNIKPNNHLRIRIDDLKMIDPLTENQKKFFNAYNQNREFIILHGVAGSGKTCIALYKALEEVLDKGTSFNKVIIVRSAVQSREIGHLPGDADEKLDVYKQPYKQICEFLFGKRDAWDRLEEQNHIEFISTSFIRGQTFDDSIIIVDEAQNMNYSELSTIITRVGYRSKIIVCGDYRQNDLTRSKNDVSGIRQFMDIASTMKSQTKIEFGIEDIVRGPLVKEWLIAEIEFNDKK